jgi:hypothetical protein
VEAASAFPACRPPVILQQSHTIGKQIRSRTRCLFLGSMQLRGLLHFLFRPAAAMRVGTGRKKRMHLHKLLSPLGIPGIP